MTPEERHSLPFLKRNFARAVNVFSGAWGSPVLSRGENGLIQENGDRPRKRRRLSSPRVDRDKLIASPRSSDSRPTLRIEVLRCHHRDSKKVRHSFGAVVSPDSTSKANCRITISDTTLGRQRVLHCESQTCKVVTFKDPAGPHRIARVELPRPFYIPRDSISVNRVDDAAWGLADAYQLSVDLESAECDTWPPLEQEDLGGAADSPLPESPAQNWVFSGTFNDLFGRLKAPLVLTAAGSSADLPRETDYEMDVDLQWTTGFMTLKRLENGAEPCITAFDTNERRINGNQHYVLDEMVDELMKDVDEDGCRVETEINGDDTPSRSLRTRGGEKTYNLKALSDKAHGRAGKQPRKQSHSDFAGEGRVKYLLPPEQPLCLDGFRCVSCGIFHQSLKHLQLHLQNTHPDYDFKLTMAGQGPPQFHVISHPEPPTTPTKTFGIKPAGKPFNLSAFISGDMTWMTSRLDADTKDDFYTSPASKAAWTALAKKSTPPRKRLSTTTVAETKTAATTPTKKRILIPESKQVFYHPVSKQVLKPGQEIPQPIAEKEWFNHRQREGLNDITDITPAELEFIKEFDGVMREHDIAARAYFPRAWLDFVQKKAAWLVEAKHRMVEFSMHESYLLASDLIRDEHIQEAMACIEDERAKRAKLQRTSPDGDNEIPGRKRSSPDPPPKIPSTRTSASGCAVCNLPVLSGPRMLICSNKDCSHRLFHSRCISSAPTTRRAKLNWILLGRDFRAQGGNQSSECEGLLTATDILIN